MRLLCPIVSNRKISNSSVWGIGVFFFSIPPRKPHEDHKRSNNIRIFHRSPNKKVTDRLSPTLLCLACNEYSVIAYRIMSGGSGKIDPHAKVGDWALMNDDK